MKKTEDIINEILNKRGILSDDDREEFLSARPKRTYDPFLLDSMKAGVDLLISAAKNGVERELNINLSVLRPECCR